MAMIFDIKFLLCCKIIKMNTPDFYLDMIKILLYFLTDTLDKHNVKYFIDGGTLLGSVRESDIIQHDDDADIGILYDDYYGKLENILTEISTKEIIINDNKCNITTKFGNGASQILFPELAGDFDGKFVGCPAVDIFCWRKKNDFIVLDNLKFRREFKNCYYKKSEMFPLIRMPFGERFLFGANNPIGYLHRYYGSDCLTVVKIDKRRPDDPVHKDRNAIIIT